MKNYWLDKKKFVSADILEEAVVEYKFQLAKSIAVGRTSVGDYDCVHELGRCFDILIDNIIKFSYGTSLKNKFDTEEIRYELREMCFLKTRRFDQIKGKGKAFNYFTTIILNQMRQIYRAQNEKLLAHQKG